MTKKRNFNESFDELCVNFCSIIDSCELLKSYLFSNHRDDVETVINKTDAMLDLMKNFAEKMRDDLFTLSELHDQEQESLTKKIAHCEMRIEYLCKGMVVSHD